MEQAEAIQPTEEQVVDDVLGSGDGMSDTFFEDDATQEEDVLGFNEVPESNAQDLTSQQQTDWEQEARKFQSLYDKAQSENDKYKGVMTALAEKQLQEQGYGDGVNQNSSSEPSLSEDEFNPWDAYYKPDSASYKYRVSQEQRSVSEAVNQQLGQMNEQIMINNTVSELKNKYKLNENEVNQFMEFATRPTEQLSLDTLVKVWRGSTGNVKRPEVRNSVEAAKAAKQAPRSPGALQGAPPAVKDEFDEMWDGVKNAGGMGSRLP
jgi:hypothetical protein|tara:strand:- start:383 stop:1174 length:792 start_codon:yes stop_codon:yes gene_type:complete